MKKLIQFSLAAFAAAGIVLSASAQTQKSVLPGAPSGFPEGLRDAIRNLATGDVRAALEEARSKGFLPGDHAIVIAPIYGDRENFVRNRLKNALTDAGLVCVEASDDRWTAIMHELGFDWGFRDILDESHMASIYERKLLPSEIMLYGSILIPPGPAGRRASAVPPKVELALHADDLRTRRHIWGRDFVGVPPPPPGPGCDEPHPVFLPAQTASSDLAVFVTARPENDDSADLALELLSIARETLGGQGFRIAFEDSQADVKVQLTVRKSVFDRTGEYAVMEGSVRAIATAPARKGYYLGETRIDRERGERVLGDEGAMLSVRDGIEPKLVSWLGQNVTAEKAGLAAVTIPCDISMMDDENAIAKFAHDFCAEAVQIDGVARCALASQTDELATFYFAYVADKLPEGPVNALRARHPELFPVQETGY